jgi:hypothetical protein
MEQATDMLESDKLTLDRNWCREQSDRFASWEILRRTVLHETSVPMNNGELCDIIGVSSSYTIRLLKSLQKRPDTEDAE